MKQLILLLSFVAFLSACSSSQSVFELSPTQSMSISGKGPGQDAAINPYGGEDCKAIVDNLGPKSFEIRVQFKGEIIEIIPIETKERKEVRLLAGYELYLDSEEASKAKVTFRKE